MTRANDIDPRDGGLSDDEGAFDPGDAAALLDRTTRRARREFEVRTPLLLLVGAMLVLVDYGGIWLSVRGQDPYTGPSGTALVLLYTFVIAGIVVTALVARRSVAGIGGRASQRRATQAVVFGAVWVIAYVFQGALDAAGAGAAIVYGIFPAVGPVVIVGSAAAGYGAAQDQRRWLALALAVVALAALAAYAGPVNVWGVMAVGFSLLLAGAASFLAWDWRRHQ